MKKVYEGKRGCACNCVKCFFKASREEPETCSECIIINEGSGNSSNSAYRNRPWSLLKPPSCRGDTQKKENRLE